MNVNGYEVIDGVLDLGGSAVTTVANKEFWACRAIRELILPPGIEHIGDWAFARCSNLTKVTFSCDFRPDLLGRDVFKGCDSLVSIMFSDSDPATGRLMALCANKIPYDHLLRADDIGQKSWFEKWDIGLVTQLKSDDAEAKMSAALCGEEDISYDDIGSVDGEMSGETEDYLWREAYRKCSLCYIRLANDKWLADKTRALIEDHIISNRFGEGNGYSFYTIFEECDSDISYLRMYLDIVKPDKQTLTDMTAALPQRFVRAKSYLIEESCKSAGGLDSLLL